MTKLFPYITILLSTLKCYSQDNQYWSNQFGAEANLLGGAVIAGTDNCNNVYYNPAALAFLNISQLDISTNAYGLEYFNARDGAGKDLDLSSKSILTYPQLFAGGISFNKLPRLKIVYAMLSRYNTNTQLQARYEGIYDVLTLNPGEEVFVNEVKYSNKIQEYWTGFGLGYKISEKFSVGLSHFGAYRSHNHNTVSNGRTVFIENNKFVIPQFNYESNANLNSFSLIFKLSALWRSEWVKLGITTTLPSIKFNIPIGSSVQREFFVSGFNPYTINNIPDYLFSVRQEDLKTVYKTPFSIAAGIEVKAGKGSLYGTYEYFSKIEEYTIIEAKDFQNTATEILALNTDLVTIKGNNKAILNVAFGWKCYISEDIRFLTSIRTDYHFFDFNTDDNISIKMPFAPLDIYHLTAGFSLKRTKSIITAGIDFGFVYIGEGGEVYDITKPSGELIMQGSTSNKTYMSVYNVNFVLGVKHYIHK